MLNFKAKPVDMEQLIEGSNGDSVKTLQQMLQQLGYDVEINGCYCNKVTNAVFQFQKSVSIHTDGTMNDITWAFLLNVLDMKKRQSE